MEFQSENHVLKPTGGNDPTLSCNAIIGGDVEVECNGPCAPVDGHDLNTNGNGCSEPSKDIKELKEEDEKLNLYNHENVELIPGHGSLHPDLAASDEYVDAITVVSSSRKVAEIDQSVAGSPISPVEAPPGIPVASPSEIAVDEQRSENLESFINVKLQNPIDADAFTAVGSGSCIDCELSASSTFGPCTVSDEESKLCTAAKHTSRKHSSNTFQRFQQDTDQVDDSIEARAEAYSMDRGNSLSSLGFDSINSSPVYMQGSLSAVDSGQSDGHVVEQSDDEPTMENPVDGIAVNSSKSVEDEDVLRGDAALSWKIKGIDENNQPPRKREPLVDCIGVLQSTQDALEQEIMKFAELGKDLQPLDDDSVRTCGLGAEVSGSSSLESPTFEDSAGDTGESSEILEKQLAQARVMLKERESRISELEATINELKTSNGDLGATINIQLKKLKEIETEFETLYKQKMETEIQHLAIADTRSTVENQLKRLPVQQKSLVTTQAQGIQKVGQLAGNTASPRDRTKETITSIRGDDGQEMREMKRRVAKLTLCFFVQLMLFMFVVVLFISESLPKTEVVLPT